MPVIYGVPGDALANGDLLLTDAASQERRYAEWGAGPDITSAMIIDSDDMVTSGFAGSAAAHTGAYDPNAAGNNVIRSTLTSQAIAVCGTGNQPHVGTFRVLARVYADATVTATSHGVRLAWQAGDGPFLPNSYATLPSGGFFYRVDLGVITVPVAVAGAQRWTGRIEAFTTGSGSGLFEVDFLLLVPVDDGWGRARGPVVVTTPTVFSARDEFDQTAGALAAKVLPIGGTWTAAGDADDFALDTTNHRVQRTAVSDTGPHVNIAGTTSLTNVVAQATFTHSNTVAVTGLLLRYVDISNYLAVYIDSLGFIYAVPVVAGAPSVLVKDPVPIAAGMTVGLRVYVSAAGRLEIWYSTGSSGFTLLRSIYDTADLATGSPLATGKVGLYDNNTTATASTRTADTFSAWAPSSAAVMFAGRSLRITHDDARRESSDGTAWGDPPSYRGSRSLIPPYGDRQRATRIVAFAHRNDLEEEPWEPLGDALQVQQAHTPRISTVPR